MSDEWMPSLELKLSRKDFDALPRHPAFKYELIEGVTHISPWPRYYHAQLNLRRFRAADDERATTLLRPARPDDLAALTPIFLGAFGQLQPYGSLSESQGLLAATRSLTRTFTGGDGPLADAASFVALDKDDIAGAILITLLPGGEATEWDSYHWHEAAPADLWAQRGGQPHLTWIFVDRFSQGKGIGTQLLTEAVRVLANQRYRTLWTTFMVGNDSSLLWHWRNGFALVPYPLSKRRRRRDLRPT